MSGGQPLIHLIASIARPSQAVLQLAAQAGAVEAVARYQMTQECELVAILLCMHAALYLAQHLTIPRPG